MRIVHGKGYRSGARGPVLKIAVNSWLKRHADVMAFTSARAIDGGTGARLRAAALSAGRGHGILERRSRATCRLGELANLAQHRRRELAPAEA